MTLRLTDADRARERQAAIDAGILDADGKVIMRSAAPVGPVRGPAGETPQQMAERLRVAAQDAEAI